MLLDSLLLLLFTQLHQALKVGILVEDRLRKCLTVAPVLISDRLLHHLLDLCHLRRLLLFTTLTSIVLHEYPSSDRGQPIFILLFPLLLPEPPLPSRLLTIAILILLRRKRVIFFHILRKILREIMSVHFVHELGCLRPQQTQLISWHLSFALL